MRASTPESAVVAANIRRTRKARGWSVRELGERCGVSAAIIENVECGRPIDGRRTRPITVDELIIFAKGLRVAPADLMPALTERPIVLSRAQLERVADEVRALVATLADSLPGDVRDRM